MAVNTAVQNDSDIKAEECLQTVLGVEQSFNKTHWVMPDIDAQHVQVAMRQHGTPELITRLLLGRGIDVENFESFLNPRLNKDFPDPFTLKAMDAMARDVAQWIAQEKSFAIFGDFDVDGATSSALLYRFLKSCGIDAPIYIPHRLNEGYGPNINAFKTLKEQGADVLFVLDCGITSFDVIKQGRELDLEIIILDHHEAEDNLPNATHVIDPKRKDDESNLDMLAAVGVTFLACVAINKTLRENGFWDGKTSPDMRVFLDLVALGTVCDMVPLTDANRLFVRHGMTQMNTGGNKGIQALKNAAGLEGAITVSHLGFVLGPRINAGGRIHKADLGAHLLCTEDHEKASEIAWVLEDCNTERKSIQNTMQRDAECMVEDQNLHNDAVIVVDNKDWHPGLSGLVAGKIKDKFGKPACVITYAKSGEGVEEGRGSGRSVAGVHLANAFIDARNEGLLIKGGGHAMAGGFTIEPDKLPAFKTFLTDHVTRQQTQNSVTITSHIDALITPSGLSVELLKTLNTKAGPFGMGFDKPLFVMSHVRIHSVDIVGEQHIRMFVSDWEGGTRIKAMAFGAVGTDMGEAFLKQGKAPFHICGHLSLNRWQGNESAEFHIKDAALVNAA